MAEQKKQKDPGSHDGGAIKPAIHCLPRLLSKRKRSVLNKSHFGGMSFCHNSQNNAIIKVIWKNDESIWTKQWPLTKEKLEATKELITTQLELKHIEEYYSPWNSPIFVIKKKPGKRRLLTDLKKVNASMKPINALQLGIPSPTTIPQNWHIIIIDLQDCFFTIPLHSVG